MLRFVGLVALVSLVGTSVATSVAAAPPQGVAREARIGEPGTFLSRSSDSTIAHHDSATVARWRTSLTLQRGPRSFWDAFRYGVDLTVRSRYDWRGITRRNAWVFQPDGFLGVGWSWGAVTAGGWTTMEFTRADPRIPEAVGLGRRWFGEYNLWGEFAWWLGSFDFAAGYVYYGFASATDAAAVGSRVFDTQELYGRVQASLGPNLTPTASAWFDVDQVRGTYLELGGTYRLPFLPVVLPSLKVGALHGISLGQEVAAVDRSHFEERGGTHWDFSATADLPATFLGKRVVLHPSFHAQWNRDLATRRVAGETDTWKFWIGVLLSWFSEGRAAP